MPSPRPATPALRYDSRKILSLLIIPIYILVIALLDILGGTATYPQPFALLLLNVAFLGVIPIYIAYVSFVSFRRSGFASILMMGSGMLFIGLGAIAAGLVGLLPGAANLVVTVHNTSTCIGASLQFAGALTALVGWTVGPAERRPSLAISVYAAVVAVTAGLVLATLLGLTPTFFAPVTGATVLRTLVLTGAIASLLIASVLFFVLYRKRNEDFFFWYAIGLALISLGLIGVSFYSVFDDPLNWAARIEQYIGACFLLVAFLVLQRRATSGNVSAQEMLARFFVDAEAGYRQLIETAGDAIIVLDPVRRVLLWNAAAGRLFGYTADEAVGMPFADLVPAAAEEPPDGDAGPVHRETEARRRDGRTVPIELAASRRSIDGEPITTCIIRDLSERRAAEAALRQTEQRFRLALRNAPVSVSVQGRDLRYVWAYNQRTATPEEIIGKRDADIFTSADAASLTAIKRRVLEEDVEVREQMWLDRPGGPIYLEIYFEPVHDEAGRVTGVGSATVDLTQRRQAEEAIAASELKYRQLFDSMTEAFALHELVVDGAGRPVDYRFVAVNPAFEEMTGLVAGEIIGRSALEVLPGLEPGWIERYGRVATTGEPEYFSAYAAPLDRWYDVHAYSPGPGRFATVFTDVTDRKRIEEALRESEKRFRILHESLRDAFVEVSMDGRILEFNDLYCEMLGYSPEEMRTLTYQELTPECWHAMEDAIVREQIVARGYSDVYEKEYRRKDGTVIPVELRTILSRDDEGRPIAMWGIARDITGRKQAEQRLTDYAEQLKTSNEELQRFAYVASHDLQEPLRSIVSFSQLLERRYKGKLDTDADEYIEFIVEGGQRMQQLIQDLLQLSRIETGAKPLEPTDAETVVARVVRAMETPIREAGATVTVGDLPVVMADEAQLAQVFTNLIGNAVKYRRPGVPAGVRVSAERQGDCWEVAVADNGIGIEAEYFDRIFEMFRRLHTRDQYDGTGIGLAVVKKIVERHGGRIRVESTPGEGSTFFFTLPAA